MLRWRCGKTRKDRIRKECFQEQLAVTSIGDKIREICLRWFGHVQCRPITTPVWKSYSMQVNGPPWRNGKPKRAWTEIVRLDSKKCNLSEDLAHDKIGMEI